MRRLLGLGLAALSALLVVIAAPAHATFPGKNGKIAFTLFNGPPAIYTINPDGSGETLLVPNAAEPAWSADGTKIAYDIIDLSNDQEGINYANPDGSNPRLVTGIYWTQGLAWSPDGTKIAFGASDFYGQEGSAIRTINLDGSSETLIAKPGIYAQEPDWLVTDKIAFISDTPTPSGFCRYLVNPDGSGLTRITPCRRGALSPDGTKVVFEKAASSSPGSTYRSQADIFVANLDGSGERRLTDTGSIEETALVWSPDGTKILFSASATNDLFNSALYVMNTDGSGVRKLTDLPYEATAESAAWQPIPGPKRADFKNSSQFCKAQQSFWGDQFSQRYGNFGRCVSGS